MVMEHFLGDFARRKKELSKAMEMTPQKETMPEDSENTPPVQEEEDRTVHLSPPQED